VRRRPHGFRPRSVAGNPTVVRSAVAAATVPAAWFGLLIAVPAVLIGDGWQAWQVGLLLVPPAVLSLVVPRHAGRLLDRLGPARTLALAAALAGAALLLAAVATARVAPTPIMISIACVTTAYGLGQPAMTAAVSGAVPFEVRGVALGLATMVFMVGASVGSAAVGGIGDAIGIPHALAVLAALPALALLVLLPSLLPSPERSDPVTDLDPREVPGG
jgi:MFS family permease